MTSNFTSDSERPSDSALASCACSAVAPVTLAKRIRWLRVQRGETRGQLAKLVGVSLSLVSLWENEKRMVSGTHLMKICEVCKVSLDFMCNSQLLPTFQMPEMKPKRRKRVAAQPNAKSSDLID